MPAAAAAPGNAQNLLRAVGPKGSEEAINTVHNTYHNYRSYFRVATRSRVVLIDVARLVGVGLQNSTSPHPKEIPGWVKMTGSKKAVLNLFDDVVVDLQDMKQTNAGSERSFRETTKGKTYPVDVRRYDIPILEKANPSSDLSISGGRVRMDRLVYKNASSAKSMGGLLII